MAQVHISQRMYDAARRTIDNLLARQATAPVGRRNNPLADGHSDVHIVALALRKRWDVSRAAGGDHGAICRDAAVLIQHCSAALGPAHYATTRAIDEHESYLRAWRAAADGGGGGGTAGGERGATATSAEELFVHGRPPDD